MVDFHRLIAVWFRLNSRSLPWRSTNNPYFIWLSEIILQQTRVAQGKDYYLKFINNYPTIQDLAQADEKNILNDWQGLGYYSRARNLHKAAKQVVSDFDGTFPKTYAEIKSLKGVGDYTAAAISSFAFKLPHAVVDGNVYRVLSRVFDIETPIDSNLGKKQFQSLADELLPKDKADLHNQAIMEFGALQCIPKNPNCTVCPLLNSCLAFANKTIDSRPVKANKTKIRNRYFNYLIYSDQTSILLEKRKQKDIWENMYQFPLLESEKQLSIDLLQKSLIQTNPKDNIRRHSPVFKHILSHQRIFAQFVTIEHVQPVNLENFIRIKKEDFQDFPIPRLIELGYEWFLDDCN
jgi:A/G-specific adenine glycosylase